MTAIIHTLNEIEQIEECIRSVEWADEVYLVDSFSTDGTVERVREKFPRVRIEQREYLGAASQKNYAIDRAAHDWIFVIDADERVTPELRDEILRTLEGPLDHWAYSVGRRNFMLGKEVKYSGLQRDRVTRLFHRGHARYPNKRVHADLLVDGADVRPAAEDAALLHPHVRPHDRQDDALRELGRGADVHRRQDHRRCGASSATPSPSSSATTSSTSGSSTARAA